MCLRVQCLEHLSLILLFSSLSLLARKHGVPVGLHREGVATLKVWNDNRLYQGSHYLVPGQIHLHYLLSWVT